MRKLILIASSVILLSSCCSKSPSQGVISNGYQVIDDNPKWTTYKIDETHFICVPNYNADKGAVPVMLEVKDKYN